MRRACTAVIALLWLAPIPARALPGAAIQPGAGVRVGDDVCTLNLVFTDGAGALYIGTAGHCVGGEGRRASFPDGSEEWGTVVYHAHTPGNVRRLDFALIRIDESRHADVSASMRQWGGPTGITPEPQAGEPVLLYGQGTGTRGTALEGRAGLLASHDENEYGATITATGGDSGAPLIEASTGRALGVVVYTNGGLRVSAHSGHTWPFVMESLRAQGWALDPVTAPYPLG